MQNVFIAHKQIEHSLRYLTTIAQQAKEGIAVVDLDGSIQFVNEAWAEMHGYETEEKLIGKQLSLFHAKEQMKTDVNPLIEEAKGCGQSESTVEHVRSDGKIFFAQTKMILVRDEAGRSTGLIIFATDIGQRAELQETTAESLGQINQLSEQITRLQKLFGECLEAGEYLAEQTGKLQANNEILQQLIAKFDWSPLRPEQYRERIVNRKEQIVPEYKRSHDMNPEQRQTKEALAEKSASITKTNRGKKQLNTKELAEVAELARRLSERP